ncbi:hypothetical protein IV203_030629 [Nitzschia inconspicua]|uniref:Uncharacterized protein n=1 Tax=Nitzschia inconspicua TaxID=303405 RepID=A0A9K3PGX6_9STRA|nr:hypothetical protein IV203_015967 [Nitzschia inconspicua]KAG7367886.1 hypothetical protein IV203_030629 [Nitzschia inconspicua]
MPSSGIISNTRVETERALQLISHQNNEGVSLYNGVRFAEAVQVFKVATSASKTLLDRPFEEVDVPENGEVRTSLQVLPSQTARCANGVNFPIDSSVYSKPFEAVLTLVGDTKHLTTLLPIVKVDCSSQDYQPS